MMDERLTKKKRNCLRGKTIPSQHRRCLNFTFSPAKYLHPPLLKWPHLNIMTLLRQFEVKQQQMLTGFSAD